MPSVLHDALLMLFRNRPSLAQELLGPALGLAELPVQVGDPDLTHLRSKELRVDLVLTFGAPPVFSLGFEVQRRIDPRKLYSFPAYIVQARERGRHGAALVVLTPSERVAAWARQPIPMGHPGFVLTPLVLGPSDIPAVIDPDEAVRCPELAVLSALIHGRKPIGPQVARAAMLGCASLETNRAMVYHDLVLSALPALARAALEAIVDSEYQFRSEFYLKRMRKDIEQGREKGREQGLEEGRNAGLIEAILTVLQNRGVRVDRATRATLRATTDHDTLQRCLVRALSASRAKDIFDA